MHVTGMSGHATRPSPPCTMYRHFRQARTSRSCAPCALRRVMRTLGAVREPLAVDAPSHARGNIPTMHLEHATPLHFSQFASHRRTTPRSEVERVPAVHAAPVGLHVARLYPTMSAQTGRDSARATWGMRRPHEPATATTTATCSRPARPVPPPRRDTPSRGRSADASGGRLRDRDARADPGPTICAGSAHRDAVAASVPTPAGAAARVSKMQNSIDLSISGRVPREWRPPSRREGKRRWNDRWLSRIFAEGRTGNPKNGRTEEGMR